MLAPYLRRAFRRKVGGEEGVAARVRIKPLASLGHQNDANPGISEASLIQIADLHHIGFPMAADDRELFAVEGEVEVADELGFEVGQLLAGRSVEILQLEIVGLAVARGIDDPLAVGAESDRTDGVAELKLHARPFEFQVARELAGIEGKQDKLLLGIIPLVMSHEGSQFSVRRDRDTAENGMVKRFLRGPAFARNFLQNVVAIDVEHSLAIGSAGGKVIEFAGAKFFRIGAIAVGQEDPQPVRFAEGREDHMAVGTGASKIR